MTGYIMRKASASGHITTADLIVPGLTEPKGSIPMTSWEQIVFNSPNPFHDADLNQERPPYPYELTVRRSGERAIILSFKREVVLSCVQNQLHKGGVKLVPQQIDIDRLVNLVVDEPDVYCLNYAHARVSSYGNALRSISLYGDDLANAALFRDQLQTLDFFSCGLSDVVSGQEIVRISNNGGISFNPQSPAHYKLIEDALGYIKKNNLYLD